MAFLNFNGGENQPYKFWQQNQTPINPSQGLFGNVFQQENQTPLQPNTPNPKQEQPAPQQQKPLLNNLPQENKTLSQYKLAQSQNYLDPLMNPTQAGVQRDLFSYKNEWQNANDAKLILQKELDDLSKGRAKPATNAEGETASETVDDTETQKQKLQEGIDLLNFHQSELAKAAEMTRNTAHALGIDTTGFNANNTLAESQQIMHTNDARAVQGLLNLRSSREQEGDYYRQLREQGYNEYAARKISREKGGDFQNNNINQLWNGIRDYGINGDGSLNNFGAALLGKLSREDPAMVELFANQYASPKETLSESNANDRLSAQIQANALLNDEKLRNAWAIAAANQEAQNKRFMAGLEKDYKSMQYKEENANARKQAELGLRSEIAGINASYKAEELKLKQAELAQKYKNSPEIKSRNSALGIIGNSRFIIVNSILDGDTETAKDAWETMEKYINDPLNKDTPYLDTEEKEYSRSFLKLTKKYLEQQEKMTLEDFKNSLTDLERPGLRAAWSMANFNDWYAKGGAKEGKSNRLSTAGNSVPAAQNEKIETAQNSKKYSRFKINAYPFSEGWSNWKYYR